MSVTPYQEPAAGAQTFSAPMFFRPQPLHFVGIGGIGMSGIAEILLNLGYPISGSDLRRSATTDRLEGLGAVIFEGHREENVGSAKAIVVTSAVNETNPEVAEARRRQIPVIPRGELLAELMRLKFGIAIAGSHGKTTTTSMTAAVLNHAALDPTVVVGGKVGIMGGSNARLGHSAYLLVESDESDGSFLKLAPILCAVTNIDREHLDHYQNGLPEILDAFTEFVNKVPFYGAAVLCLDDENVQQMLPRVTRRVLTYGVNPQADLRVTHYLQGPTSSRFMLQFHGEDLGEVELRVPGYHNILNATAAAGIALELGVPFAQIQEGLALYSGVDRRFQLRGEEQGVTVVDDYGHHPTEVRATLNAARQGNYRRVLVLFQPHRYTRTLHLLDDFARAFHQADMVYLMDIYAASETPIEGVTSQALAERMRAFGHRAVQYVGSLEQGAQDVAADAREGDLVVTLGAGSVTQAGDKILTLLRHRTEQAE